jgi:cysteine desulfurase/selenocysteine lyase
MNDVTPELIAQIATRLYNELPGESVPSIPVDASQVPAPPSSIPQPTLPREVPSMATFGALPTSGAIPSPSSFSGHLPAALTSLPGGIPMAPEGAREIPGGLDHGGQSSPDQYAGLKSFVHNLRARHSHSQGGLCAEAPEQTFLHQLLAGGRVQSDSGARPFDVAAVKKDFPALHQQVHGRQLVWLDNAATTQKPQSVIDAISNYYSRDNSNIHRGAHTLAARSTDAFEQAREKIQRFVGASSAKEIIYVRGTTEGINLIAQTYGRKFLQPGDEIILSTLEHHANIVPWQMIAREKGAVIRVIPVNDRGEVMLEQYQALLGPRTRLVALAHASNALGTILPIAEMIQMAKRYNARVLIDGAQSVAHLPVNVQQLDIDFFVFSGHKIFGPTGIGAVFAKEELQEIMPPWQGGGNMIKNVTFEETTYNPPPAKFEAGTPNIADAVGLGAALDYVNRLGLANIARYEHELLEYGTEKLSQINGLRLIGTAREKVGVLSFVLPNRRTEDVGKALDMEGIAVRAGHHCAQPSLRRFGLEASVRPSLSLYNTKEDLDRLADAIRRIQRMSSPS